MVVNRFFATMFALSIGLSVAKPALTLDEDAAAFVENNLMHILFHETGHAVIDQFQLPVLGQEEDAADSFATVEIINVYDDPLPILADSAVALFILDERLGGNIDIADYYGQHDLDIQRGYRIICYAVGIDPERYGDLADAFDLSEDRAETCEDDGWLALDSWEVLLEPAFLPEGKVSDNVRTEFDIDGLTPTQKKLMLDSGVMEEFSAYLRETFDWPSPITVTIDLCNEANAYYDPATVTISMCAEFVDELIDLSNDL